MSERRTKIALRDALNHLLAVKPLNKITIQELADECGINRMTFYYHFRDIYDLVEWSVVEDGKALLDGQKNPENWRDGYELIFLALLKNKNMVMNVYRCVGRERIENFIYPHINRLILEVIAQLDESRGVPEEKRMFVARYYSYALAGLVLDWIQDNMREPCGAIADRAEQVTGGAVRASLRALR